MSARVIINGAFGKMGAVTCEALRGHPDFTVVATLGRNDDLAKQIQQHQAQIVVDFTQPDCVYEHALTIIDHQVHPVIGTTGLSSEQIQFLQHQCEQKQLGGIIAPNFSICVALLVHFAATAARFLPEVEIIEMHHPKKQDAPSGTALKTADIIAAARLNPPMAYEQKNILAGARGANYQQIPIHSLRLPGILAKQQVLFGNAGETLSITHESIDRHSFMPGLILACQRVQTLKTLYYGLENLLDF